MGMPPNITGTPLLMCHEIWYTWHMQVLRGVTGPYILNEDTPSNTRDRSITRSLQRRISTKSSISQLYVAYFNV